MIRHPSSIEMIVAARAQDDWNRRYEDYMRRAIEGHTQPPLKTWWDNSGVRVGYDGVPYRWYHRLRWRCWGRPLRNLRKWLDRNFIDREAV